MRVAILGQFPVDLTRLGGVEVAIVYLMDTLRSVGVDDLHIITCRSELARPQTTTRNGVSLHYLPRRNQGRMTWHLREVGMMNALLREIKPDIVHGHSTGLYAGAALSSGFANVITAHGIVAREVALYQGLGMRLRGGIDALYERYCLGKAQDIIAISPYVEDIFRPLTKARFHLVENAVGDSFFALTPQPEPERILFAGAVLERKGLIPLVRALAVVKHTHPQLELRIAGGTPDPRYHQALVGEIDRLGITRHVTFLGMLDQERLLAEYRACALSVMPSFQETAPMAVQQSLAAAVPVVATPAGGVPAIVTDGETGLLTPIGDSDALAAAISRLLSDEPLRAAMGVRARADAETRFKPEVVAHKTKAVYDMILSSAGRV